MIEYGVRYHQKLFSALGEHAEIVAITLVCSLVLAVLFTMITIVVPDMTKIIINLFSAIYAIPSLAMFAMLIPLTGLGKTTAIIVLTVYSQYILLRNFITGLNEVDSAIIDAAMGMGMTKLQILWRIRLPLCKKSIITGIRLSIVSTISIATIAASINAGGLGTILFDGLRTMNINKILWGTILSAGLALAADSSLLFLEVAWKSN